MKIGYFKTVLLSVVCLVILSVGGCLGGTGVNSGGGPGEVGGTVPGEVGGVPGIGGAPAAPERDPIFVSDPPDDFTCINLDDKLIAVDEFFACPDVLKGTLEDQVIMEDGLCRLRFWDIFFAPDTAPGIDCASMPDVYKHLRTSCKDILATWCLRLQIDPTLGITYYEPQASYEKLKGCCENNPKEWCDPYREDTNSEPPDIEVGDFCSLGYWIGILWNCAPLEQLLEEATQLCQGFTSPPAGYYLRNNPTQRLLGQCGPFEVYILAEGTQDQICRLTGFGYTVDKRCNKMRDFCQALRSQDPEAIQELLSSGS